MEGLEYLKRGAWKQGWEMRLKREVWEFFLKGIYVGLKKFGLKDLSGPSYGRGSESR